MYLQCFINAIALKLLQYWESQMTFRQVEVPELSLFCTLKQTNKIMEVDFCPHLIAFAQSPDPDITYLMFPIKPGHLSIVTMELGCILRKHSVEIAYSYNCKITAITTLTIRDPDTANTSPQDNNSRFRKGVYILIGFDDGCVVLYLILESSNYSLVQVLKIHPKLPRKQPVINIKPINNDLILVCAYSVWVYPGIFKKQRDEKPNSGKKKMEANQKQIKIEIDSYKLNGEIDSRNNLIYIFNEYQGAVALHLSTLHENRKIQDSIKILKLFERIAPAQSNIVAVGSTDDAIKFIDYEHSIVDKFVGFKNYPTYFEEDPEANLLWVSDLEGSISCFAFDSKARNKRQSFILYESTLKMSKKVCQNGIKKIVVIKNILIVIDTNHDIMFYDIIKTQSTTEQTSNAEESDQAGSQEKD